MFIPKDFRMSDFEPVKDFIQQTVLANIVASQNDVIEICPVPLLWQDDGSEFGCLIGHVAKMNPIVQYLGLGKNCKVIFNDNGHYISPNWYPSKAETHKEVPTWNYQSVQLTATPTLYHDADMIKGIIGDMTDFFEAQFSQSPFSPWSLADAPSEYIEAMCRALVGFKLDIVSFEAKFKLSQNKSLDNQNGVIKGLQKVDTANAKAMATLVNKHCGSC
ncbi:MULTISPECIES: FMN-binding negative transcriptional regulator [unclassified Moraxella]|uniref:FMN-binding negative transcriptional regulator n=1 Tax=unclassified Moraxella TaxID=2685852 RepID=UPI003AF9D41D